jgi:hypothetical protein
LLSMLVSLPGGVIWLTRREYRRAIGKRLMQSDE